LVIGDVAYKILALYFPENKDFQLWQPIHTCSCMEVLCIFFQYVCVVLLVSALEQIWGVRNFIFLYFLWIRRCFVAYGVNYYYFQDGLNNANGFPKQDILQLLNEGKIDM
jgi:hypothetical protein